MSCNNEDELPVNIAAHSAVDLMICVILGVVLAIGASLWSILSAP